MSIAQNRVELLEILLDPEKYIPIPEIRPTRDQLDTAVDASTEGFKDTICEWVGSAVREVYQHVLYINKDKNADPRYKTKINLLFEEAKSSNNWLKIAVELGLINAMEKKEIDPELLG